MYHLSYIPLKSIKDGLVMLIYVAVSVWLRLHDTEFSYLFVCQCGLF